MLPYSGVNILVLYPVRNTINRFVNQLETIFTMNDHDGAVIVWIILMLVRLGTSDYAGLSLKLTRLSNDKFENPTATACNWQEENRKFCKDANSRCDGNCCQCTCDYQTSTFDRSTMMCRTNKEFRSGCKVSFKNVYENSQIKVLDLTRNGGAEINWPAVNGDQMKSFIINSTKFYHNGSEIPIMFLHENGKPRMTGDKWTAPIQWNKVSPGYSGKLFRVDIWYQIERSVRGGKYSLNLTDCFVFKSSGSITVTYPSRLSTELSSSTTEESTSPLTSPLTSPSTLPSSSTEEAEILPTTPEESKETREPTEPTEKPSEKEGGTFGARKDGSGGGSTAVTASLVVVGCLVLVVIVLIVLWLRRRSAKALNEKNGAPVDTCGSVDNPMMSQMENIYAEADVNHLKKGTDNVAYDYVRGNLETNYTSLDMNKVESVPTYESLINTQNNMYEQIPVKENAKSPSVAALGAQTPIVEPFYNVVDDHVLDEPEENNKTREIPGRTGHESSGRVYSTLEEDDIPENCGREIPGRTGYDDTERVYSVLQDETAESDYLTVLPEKSDYEQPINPPVPDA